MVNEHFEPAFNAAMRPLALYDTVRLKIDTPATIHCNDLAGNVRGIAQ